MIDSGATFMKTAMLGGFALVSLAIAGANSAKALVTEPLTTTYDWSGTCTDCTYNGGSTVYAQLVVTSNYVLGNDLSPYFVSLTYLGSDMIPGGFEITSSSPDLSVSGSLPTVLPGPASFSISDLDFTFASNLDAEHSFFVASKIGACAVTTTVALCDLGVQNSVSAAVPDSSTWAMMILGFAGLGFVGYRRTRKAVSIAA
jgi:hypothetical protein